MNLKFFDKLLFTGNFCWLDNIHYNKGSCMYVVILLKKTGGFCFHIYLFICVAPSSGEREIDSHFLDMKSLAAVP